MAAQLMGNPLGWLLFRSDNDALYRLLLMLAPEANVSWEQQEAASCPCGLANARGKRDVVECVPVLDVILIDVFPPSAAGAAECRLMQVCVGERQWQAKCDRMRSCAEWDLDERVPEIRHQKAA